MIKNKIYEQPSAELIEVRFEENILSIVPGQPGDDEEIDDQGDF